MTTAERLADEATQTFQESGHSYVSASGFRLGYLAGFKAASPSEDPLQAPVMLQQQIKQMSLNFTWLLARVDEAHTVLCPDRLGTWQQRAEQMVETAKQLRTEVNEILVRSRQLYTAITEKVHTDARAVEAQIAAMTPEQKAALGQEVLAKLKGLT